MADKEVTFRIGNILKTAVDEFRIIAVGESITVVQLNTKKLVLKYLNSASVYQDILDEKIAMQECSPSDTVVDISNTDQVVIERFKKDKLVCEMIRAHFAPTYRYMIHNRKDSFIADVRKEYGYTKPTLSKKLCQYFQSGFDEVSLIDKRHFRYKTSEYTTENGKIIKNKVSDPRVSEKDKEIMLKYMKQYVSSKYTRVTDAYRDMLNDHYRYKKENTDGSITFGSISDDAPSEFQFRRFINSRLTPKQKDAITMKKHEIRNNKRLLTGSASTGISYPGECVEIDEVDMPVSLVSRFDPTQTVGRANVYMMIDVLTHVILCVGVAFNQNSYVGLTNMFINLCDDKVTYCESYGLHINADDWPSGIIPTLMRCDQGSDFKGQDIYTVCQQLGIERNLEPVATGSMKSLIENSFRLIQQQQRGLFESIGVITKDWGSKHHKEAMLNIDQFTKTLLILIIEHNKRAMKNYSLTPEQLTLGVKARPVELWKYYCDKVQSPRPITNKQQFLIALMKNGTAYYDRKGLHFLKRTYTADIDEIPDFFAAMYINQEKRTPVEIKYDPRNMNNIYYVNKSKLVVFKMNARKQENKGYANLTEQEMIKLNAQRAALDKEEKNYNNLLYADGRSNIKAIINESYTDILPTDKDMRENRKIEKSAIAQSEYDIASRIGIDTSIEEFSNALPETEENLVLSTPEEVIEESQKEPESVEKVKKKPDMEEMLKDIKMKGRKTNRL